MRAFDLDDVVFRCECVHKSRVGCSSSWLSEAIIYLNCLMGKTIALVAGSNPHAVEYFPRWKVNLDLHRLCLCCSASRQLCIRMLGHHLGVNVVTFTAR
jgi:hypothetical protein